MVHEVEMLFHASLPSAPNNEGSHAEITIMQHENDAAFPLSPSQRPSSNAVPGGKRKRTEGFVNLALVVDP